jgi:hypothetical protein
MGTNITVSDLKLTHAPTCSGVLETPHPTLPRKGGGEFRGLVWVD